MYYTYQNEYYLPRDFINSFMKKNVVSHEFYEQDRSAPILNMPLISGPVSRRVEGVLEEKFEIFLRYFSTIVVVIEWYCELDSAGYIRISGTTYYQ